MQRLLVSTTILIAAIATPSTAAAESSALELGASATGTTFATASTAGLSTTAVWSLPSLRLGATVAAARGDGYLGGYARDTLTTASASASAYWRALYREGLGFELGGALGVRALASPGTERGLVLGGELEARVTLGRGRVRGTVGVVLPAWIAVAPTVEPDELSQLTRAGLEVEVGAGVWATAMAEVGGAFGYDGDGAKFRAAAQVGMKWMPATARARESAPGGSVGVFLATEWRAFGLAGHASHGPGIAAGVTFLRGALKLGILGHGRPGPINPATFATMPVDGQTYQGKSSLALRSDGNFIGLVVAPAFRAGPVRIEVPVAFGQAAYGFYLTGEDRRTPDGKRVSAWEDQLFGGKDSSFALGGEAGVVVAVPVRPWLEPYLAARYSVTFGYDTLVRDDYGGPSLGLGVQLRP